MDIFGSDEEGAGDDTQPIAVKKSKFTFQKLNLPDRMPIPNGLSGVALRMPNFVKIIPDVFEKESHDESAEEKKYSGATSAIRWRYKKDESGNTLLSEDANGKKHPQIESNARLVKWSDGSMELIVGKECFKVSTNAMMNSFVFAHETSVGTGPNPESNQEKDDDEANFDGGNIKDLENDYSKYNVTQSSCLECMIDVGSSMKIEPLSLDSAAHAKMSLKVSDKYKKQTRISTRNFESIEENPDLDIELRIQQEEKELRAERKRRQQQQSEQGNNYFSLYGSGKGIGMNANYLEEDSGGNYDSVSLAQLKDKQKKKPTIQKYTQSSRSFRDEEEDEEDDSEEDSETDEDNGELKDFIVEDEEEDEEARWFSTKKKEKSKSEDKGLAALYDEGSEGDDDEYEADEGEESEDESINEEPDAPEPPKKEKKRKVAELIPEPAKEEETEDRKAPRRLIQDDDDE